MTEDISLVTTLLNRNLELEETVRKLKQKLARKSSESTVELDKAMYKFHQQLKQPKMSGENPFLKNKYATLADIDDSLRKAFEGTGLSYSQDARTDIANGIVSVVTTIHHESGEYRSYGPFELKPAKADVQGYGGAVTYAKRYAVSAVFGIVADPDDDGESAMDRKQGGAKSAKKGGTRKATQSAKQPRHAQQQDEQSQMSKDEAIKQRLLEKVAGLGANAELIEAWSGLPADKAIADMTAWHKNREQDPDGLSF